MPHKSLDVVIIIIVTAIALALALLGLDSGIVLILLGAPLVFFLPGYALTALAGSTLSAPKRTVLSVVLSLGLTEIGQLVLPLTPWGLQISSWAVWLGSITLAAGFGALIHDQARSQRRVRRRAAMRSLMVCGVACAVFTALGGAHVVTTQSVSAALLQRWIVPSESTTPLVDALRVALENTGPVPAPATATATATPSLPAVAATATSTPTPAPVPSTTPAPAQAAMPPADDPPVANRLDIALSDWPTRETNTASMRSAADRYQLALNGQPSVSVASVIPAKSYQLHIDVALAEGEAGVVFLAAEPAVFYRIMFNIDGAYAIQQVQQDGTATPLVDWTTSPALQRGEQIRVRIERQGDMIKFFANDQPLTTFVVPPGQSTNQAGVALAATSEQAQATFTALVVERLARR